MGEIGWGARRVRGGGDVSSEQAWSSGGAQVELGWSSDAPRASCAHRRLPRSLCAGLDPDHDSCTAVNLKVWSTLVLAEGMDELPYPPSAPAQDNTPPFPPTTSCFQTSTARVRATLSTASGYTYSSLFQLPHHLGAVQIAHDAMLQHLGADRLLKCSLPHLTLHP